MQICAVHDPLAEELTTVENVSLYGARVTTQHYWEPGTHIEVKSTSGVYIRPVLPKARARVVYCVPADGLGFVVGLDFLSRKAGSDIWSVPPTRNN